MSAGWMPGIVDPIYIQNTIQYSQHPNVAISIVTLKGILASTMVASRLIANFLEGVTTCWKRESHMSSATLQYHIRHPDVQNTSSNCCQPQERHNRSPKALHTYIHDTLTESSKGLQGLRSLQREEQECVRQKYRSIKYHALSEGMLDLFASRWRPLKADHITHHARKTPPCLI